MAIRKIQHKTNQQSFNKIYMGLLDDLKLGDCKYDLSTFNGRLAFGLAGEKIFMEALRLNIIENDMYVPAPCVDPNNRESISINARYGDVIFARKRAVTIDPVDVKCTNFVSDKSLKEFVDGGWYMFNAFVLSEKKYYFMIRKSEDFVKFVKTECTKTERGYLVNYWNIPSDPKSAGLELYPGLDPNGYKNIIMNIRSELEKSGLDHNVILSENYEAEKLYKMKKAQEKI